MDEMAGLCVQNKTRVRKMYDRTPFMEFCALCGRRIGRKMKMISALGKQYHTECFCCKHCKKPLTIDGFEARIGALYCKPKCYVSPVPTMKNGSDGNKKYPPPERCLMCREIVTKWNRHKLVDEPLHSDCFYCANCERPLNVWKYTFIQSKPHCAPACREPSNPRSIKNGDQVKFICQGCQEPTSTSDRINVLEQVYHQSCFVCEECGAELNIWKFQMNGERLLCHPICKNRVKTPPKPEIEKLFCDVCDQIIQRKERVTAENRSYHKQCLRCHLCGKDLDVWRFKQDGNKLSCTPQCTDQSMPITPPADQGPLEMCMECRKPVFGSDRLMTLSGVYHRNCFKCWRCGRILNVWKHQIKEAHSCCDPTCPKL